MKKYIRMYTVLSILAEMATTYKCRCSNIYFRSLWFVYSFLMGPNITLILSKNKHINMGSLEKHDKSR